jgi:HAD superfamily hydrolase (TIGR01490 family)
MRAAFFDLEKTVSSDAVEMTVTRMLWKQGEAGKGGWLKMARTVWLYLKYDLGISSNYEELRQAGAKMLAGFDFERGLGLYRKVYNECLRDTVYAEARARISSFQQDNVAVAIVSATYRFMVEPFAEDLEIKHFVGQEIEIDKGICTGHLAGPVWHGENKARYVLDFASEHGCDLNECWAFGDSWNDMQMLEAVGHPVAVNPGKKLYRHARANAWEIVEWGKDN